MGLVEGYRREVRGPAKLYYRISDWLIRLHYLKTLDKTL